MDISNGTVEDVIIHSDLKIFLKNVVYCSNNEAVRITYREKGSVKSILKFKNINRSTRVPFVVTLHYIRNYL